MDRTATESSGPDTAGPRWGRPGGGSPVWSSRSGLVVPNYINVIRDPARYARTLLSHRVPVTLLFDLLDPPSSRDVYRAEAVAGDIAAEEARTRAQDADEALRDTAPEQAC